MPKSRLPVVPAAPAPPPRPARLSRDLAGELREYLAACETALTHSDTASDGTDLVRWCHDLRGNLETLLLQQAGMILSLHLPLAEPPGFRQLLADVFGEFFFLHYHEIRNCHGRVVADYAADARCIHGHFDAKRLRARYPQARLITWVRHPVQGVVAQYEYWRREPDLRNPLCRALHGQNWSLLEFARQPRARNNAAEYFGTLRPADFSFIGLWEEIPASVELLMRRLQVTAVPIFQHYRQTASPVEQPVVAEAETAEIAGLNETSCRLYGECRAWFEQACREAGIAPASGDGLRRWDQPAGGPAPGDAATPVQG